MIDLLSLGLGAGWLLSVIVTSLVSHRLTAKGFTDRRLVRIALELEPLLEIAGGLYASKSEIVGLLFGGRDGDCRDRSDDEKLSKSGKKTGIAGTETAKIVCNRSIVDGSATSGESGKGEAFGNCITFRQAGRTPAQGQS